METKEKMIAQLHYFMITDENLKIEGVNSCSTYLSTLKQLFDIPIKLVNKKEFIENKLQASAVYFELKKENTITQSYLNLLKDSSQFSIYEIEIKGDFIVISGFGTEKSKSITDNNSTTQTPIDDKFEELKTLVKIKDSHGPIALSRSPNVTEIKNTLKELIGCSIEIIHYYSGDLDFIEYRGEKINNYNIKIAADLKDLKSNPHFYIYDIFINTTTTNEDLIIKGILFKQEKKKVTFSIANDIYEEFDKIADRLAINKSKFVENRIAEFVKANK